jgi:hypothetical protein
MSKLLPNRISEQMTDAQLKQFRDGIEMAFAAIPKRPIMSKEEFDKIPKKAEFRIKEANLRIKVVRKYPKYLPAALTLQDVENDNALHGQVNKLSTETLQPFVDAVAFILGLSGGEELNAYNRYTDNVKKAKDDGDQEAIAPFDELDAVDKQLGLGAYKNAPLSPEEKALKAEQAKAMKAIKAAKKK